MEEERLKALAIDIFVQQQRMVEGKVQDVYINITVGDVEQGAAAAAAAAAVGEGQFIKPTTPNNARNVNAHIVLATSIRCSSSMRYCSVGL